MSVPQNLPRREVFLVMKEISDGSVILVEGVIPAANYYFDGVARTLLQQPQNVSLQSFDPHYSPAHIYHLPKEKFGKWHATYHAFGGSPEFSPEIEYVISVAAYSNNKDKTLKMLKAAVEYAEKILDGEVVPRNGEFPYTL